MLPPRLGLIRAIFHVEVVSNHAQPDDSFVEARVLRDAADDQPAHLIRAAGAPLDSLRRVVRVLWVV